MLNPVLIATRKHTMLTSEPTTHQASAAPIVVHTPGARGKVSTHISVRPNPVPVVIGASAVNIRRAVDGWLDQIEADANANYLMHHPYLAELPVGPLNIGQFELPIAVSRLVFAGVLPASILDKFRFYGKLDGYDIAAPAEPEIPELFVPDAKRVTIVPPDVESRFEGISTKAVGTWDELVAAVQPS